MFKKSIYNKLVEFEGRNFLFGGMNTALDELDEATLERYLHIERETEEDDGIRALLERGYIVRDEEDELARIRTRYEERNSHAFLHLTIAPTLSCNCACPYCLEKTRRHGSMNKETQQQLLRMVESGARQGKNITVTWYGGEPLIAMDAIEALSGGFIASCSKAGVGYAAKMVTNAYLADGEVIERLKRCLVTSLQVTLDGSQQTHDSRRVLANGKGTYDRIFENIKKAHGAGLKVNIRINVDKENIEEAEGVLDELGAASMTDVDVHLGMIKDFNCHSNCSTLQSTEEFAAAFLWFQETLYQHGFARTAKRAFPTASCNSCTANCSNSFVVGPDGSLYQCLADLGNREAAIGVVASPERVECSFLPSPFDREQCIGCQCLPYCMGSCPKVNGRQGCSVWKYILPEFLEGYCRQFA